MAMASAAAKQARPDYTHALRVALDAERFEILEALANNLANGEPSNRAAAVRYLIDAYAGREIERLQLEAEDRARPSVEIVRFARARLSKELIGTVAGAILAGLSTRSACELAGITERQVRSWTVRGKKDRGDGKESLYADFVTGILQAEAEQKAETIAIIREHRKKTWTAGAWLLERMYPDEFGERKRLDSKVQHSLMPMIDYDRLTVGEARTLVELLRKASPDADDPSVGRFARPAAELIPQEIAEAVDGEWTPIDDKPEARMLEAPALGGPAPPTV